MINFKKTAKRISAGIMAGLCAASMLATTAVGMIPVEAAEASTENPAFPSADALIAQAVTLLGTKYGFGFKGYSGIYYQGSYKPLTEEYIRGQGIDCSGLIYYSMTHLGYSTTGFDWNNPVPVDTEHWLSVNSKCTITYDGVTSQIDIEKQKIPTKERPYWECADGSTITPGSVVVAEIPNDINHSWIYMGEFNTRDDVITYLRTIGVPESKINDKTVGDGTGEGGTHWRIESNGSEGVVINNKTTGKKTSALNMYAFRITQNDVKFTITKVLGSNNTVRINGTSPIDGTTEAGQAFEYMGMAGWETEDMLAGIEGVMNLAAASGENLATTSDIVTDALTAFGYTAADTGNFVDVLAAAATNSNTNVYMMGESFKYVGTTAGALGYSIEDMAVAIGLMANSSVKGSQAGTSLRALLVSMSDPTDEAAQIMERYGLSLFNADGSAKDFSVVLEDLRNAFAGMTKQEKEANASVLAGRYGMSGLLAIVNATEKDVTDLTEAIQNSDGMCQRMADTMNSTLIGQFEIFKSAVSAVYTSIYELLEPSLMKMVQAGQQAANTIDGMLLIFSNAQKEGKTVFESISLAFGMVEGMAEHGTIPAYFDRIAEAVRWAADKLSALHEAGVPLGEIALKALAIGPALIGVGTVVSGLGGIFNTFGGIIGMVSGLLLNFGSFGAVFSGFGTSFGAFLKAGYSGIGKLIQKFSGFVSMVGAFSLNGVTTGVSKLFSVLQGGIIGIFPKLSLAIAVFEANIHSVFGRISPVLDGVLGKVRTVLGGFGKAFASFLGTATQFGGQFAAILMKCFGFGAIGGLVLVGLGLIQQHFGDKISDILSDVQKNAPEIITTFCSGIMEKIPDLIAQGTELVNSLLQTIIALTPSLITGGSDILLALVNGFALSMPSLIENVGGIIVTIITSLTEKLPDMLAAGMAVLGALISGISAVMPSLIPAAVSMILTLASGLIDQLPDLIDSGILLIMALADGLIAALPEISQKVPEIITKLVTTLVEKAPDLLIAAVEIILALTSGLQTALPMLTDRIPEMFENIRDAFLSVDWKSIGVSLCELIAQGFVNIVNTVIGVLNSIISSANTIPGVNIPTIPEWIPSFAHGTDHFAGGFALINESGKGEIVNLPNGSQVIPHDISRKYASEAARMNTSASVVVIDYDAIGAAVASALERTTIRAESYLDGQLVSEKLAPDIDRILARKNTLSRRT